jgi:uncharacterized protein
MISQNIQKLIGEAMKARDEVRLSTLRMLSSALNYEKINKQSELTEDEELAVIRKQAKQRNDSIESYQKLKDSQSPGIQERIQREMAGLKILKEFLPPEMGEEELSDLVDGAISEMGAVSMADMGKVIGAVKSKASGVEGGRIAEIVKQKLT